ncbi:MAG TPA: copper resistance protein CopD [Nitrospiraceae bacterium]|jgi:putative copper resistance protein D|nr:copper resistance protein CopD [Nitrospiraceae bacterium]
MIFVAGLLEVLFKALVLIGMASAVGGAVFCLVVLRPLESVALRRVESLKTSLMLIVCSSGLLAFAQGMVLLIEPWAFADETGRWPLTEFLTTQFARASLLHACMGLFLLATAIWLLKRPASRLGWAMMTVTLVPLMASGVWLVHAASHIDHAAQLMTVTVVHQFSASVWAGGVLHLAVLQRPMRNSLKGMCLWPAVVARFSLLAVFSIATLLVTALYLSLHYVRDWNGLIGTAYGAMAFTKASLLALVLGLGALNFFSVQRWIQRSDGNDVSKRAPALIEAEMYIAMVILLAAATLSSQPPAVDVLAERASPMEVLQVFSPKLPQLTPPPHQEMLAHAASSFDLLALPSTLDKIQSNFNHNICGLLLLIIGIFAMLARSGKLRFVRHWPLLFLLLALFILLVGEPAGWPFGTEGFWETLVIPEVLQHRLAALLVASLGLFEWRVRTRDLAHTRWCFAFPLLCLAGGALLLIGSHTALEVKSAFLNEVSHNAIGFLAVGMGVGRWLELRLTRPANRLPGLLWIACMVLVSFVLLFYREA